MISLPLPENDPESYITKVVEERQNGMNALFFRGIEKEWKIRCKRYIETGGDGHQIDVWPVANKHAVSFQTLYSQPGDHSVQGPCIRKLRDRTMTFCPICGEAGTPNTLDHYLPQATYPHFCILPANLVPACDICQGHKLEKVGGPNGRLFIHPYFDTWIQGQIVRLKLKAPYGSPSPSLTCHPTLEQKHVALVERHLSELAIEKRFWAFFRKDYIRLLKLVGRARERKQDVVDKIRAMAEHAADRSLNCWEHILYEGVLEDDKVISYLRSGSLPLFN